MRRVTLYAAVVACISAIALAGCGSTGITASDVRSRSTPASATNAVVYLDLKSNGRPDSLTGADVDPAIASSATLHQEVGGMGTSDTAGSGMMDMTSMQPVASIPLPKGKTVKLAPGGYHVMLEGLKHPLANGEVFRLDLHFQSGTSKDVTVSVHDNV